MDAYLELELFELGKADVFISTCVASNAKRFDNFEYCACLVDETSQIIEPETLIPIIRSPQHFVLVGDNK